MKTSYACPRRVAPQINKCPVPTSRPTPKPTPAPTLSPIDPATAPIYHQKKKGDRIFIFLMYDSYAYIVPHSHDDVGWLDTVDVNDIEPELWE